MALPWAGHEFGAASHFSLDGYYRAGLAARRIFVPRPARPVAETWSG